MVLDISVMIKLIDTLLDMFINSSLNGTKVGHWVCHPRILDIIIMDYFRLLVLGMGP